MPLNAVFNFLMGIYRHKLLQIHSIRTRDNRHKLQYGKLQLDGMKNICRIKVVKPWSRLPRESMKTPLLWFFKLNMTSNSFEQPDLIMKI